jgi:uncharacterized protein involved in tolerance to divalent cations
MVSVIIYLKQEHNPKEIVEILLSEKLIASASIDQNNVSYKMSDGKLVEEIYSVITSQSKALLFNDIVETVEKLVGEKVAINSIPIVGANGFFNDTIKTKTIPI